MTTAERDTLVRAIIKVAHEGFLSGRDVGAILGVDRTVVQPLFEEEFPEWSEHKLRQAFQRIQARRKCPDGYLYGPQECAGYGYRRHPTPKELRG